MTSAFRRYHALLATAAFALLSALHSTASAQVPLGTAQTYGVLGASAVTNTGPSVVNGNLGVSPGNSVTGFPPGLVTGTTNVANAAALQAQTDASTAFNFLAGQACGTTLTGDLGGRTLTPGVYCLASSAQLTGALTLDAQGTAGAVFIFQIGSTLTTAAGSSVVLINSASACNVWWQVGSSATLGTTTAFAGTVIALASVTMNTAATLAGRAIALTAAVTLDSNTVNVPACAAPACPVITLTPLTLPSGAIGTAFAQTISTAGTASLPATFSLLGGALPPGLVLGPNGTLAGTPTTAGVFTFTLAAADTAACSGNRTYTVTIAAALVPGLPGGPAAPIPTLSEWAMILLVALVAVAGFAGMRRRAR